MPSPMLLGSLPVLACMCAMMRRALFDRTFILSPSCCSMLCSPPAANIVFWALQLKGSFFLFWLIYFFTLTTGIGE